MGTLYNNSQKYFYKIYSNFNLTEYIIYILLFSLGSKYCINLVNSLILQKQCRIYVILKLLHDSSDIGHI